MSDDENGGVGRGHISTEYTFWCATCAHWARFASGKRTLAIKDAQAAGWRRTTQHGWRCACCSHKAGMLGVATAAERQRAEQLRAGRS